jgi:uncharacterized protein with gpF-like domain
VPPLTDMPRLRNDKGRDVVLRPVRANAGVAAAYRRKLVALIDDMARSYAYFVRAQYRETPPRMAADASPAKELERALRKLARRWKQQFADAAPRLALWFSRSVDSRSTASLRKILRDGGFSVRFRITPEVRDILDATIAENVSLIKSIPSKFATEIEGMVMRSVTAGRDLRSLTRDLRSRYRVTRDRAEFIALDQNNKATTAIRRTRETSLGLSEGIWLHSHAGKQPRRTHVANHGKRFSIAKGWYDPDQRVRRRIMPGELPRCRCTWRPVVKGFS